MWHESPAHQAFPPLPSLPPPPAGGSQRNWPQMSPLPESGLCLSQAYKAFLLCPQTLLLTCLFPPVPWVQALSGDIPRQPVTRAFLEQMTCPSVPTAHKQAGGSSQICLHPPVALLQLPAWCRPWRQCSSHLLHLPQVLVTFENLAAWGRCLCAACPSPTTIITSGTSAVVCVWELSMTKGRATGLHLKQVRSLPRGVGSGQV